MFTALVIDDEKIIREGISRKITRLYPDIKVYQPMENALDALEFMKENHVDIVLTDIKMPEMDGLELIKRAKTYNNNIDFIIISGYKNFDYAKTAISLGVKDYLLKPINNNELKEIISNLLRKLQQKVETDIIHSQIRSRAVVGKEYMKNKYLTELSDVESDLDTIQVLNELEKLDIIFKDNNFLLISIIMDNINELPEFQSIDDVAIIQYAICNILNETFAVYGAVSFVHLTKENQIVIIMNTDKNILSNLIRNKSREIIELLKRIYALEIRIGISEPFNVIEEICKGYIQAYQAAMQNIMMQNESKLCFYNDIKNGKLQTQFLTNMQKDILSKHIKQDNQEQLKIQIKSIIDECYKENITFESMKILCFDVYILLKKMLDENETDSDIITIGTLENVVNKITTIDQLENWLLDNITRVSKIFVNNKKSYGKQVIDDVKSYVENNYNKDISLSTLAKKFIINTSYLSQLFKKETGLKYIDYITLIRIEKAKELLVETELSVNDISEIIGYTDTRYFRDVFTRHIDKSPSSYRKHIKNLP